MYKRKIPKMFPGSKVTLKPALFRTAPKTELMVSRERLSSPLRCRISSIAGISLVLITPEFYTKLTTCIEILTVSTAWDSTQVDKLQLSTPLASRTKPRSYFYKPGSLLQQTVIQCSAVLNPPSGPHHKAEHTFSRELMERACLKRDRPLGTWSQEIRGLGASKGISTSLSYVQAGCYCRHCTLGV